MTIRKMVMGAMLLLCLCATSMAQGKLTGDMREMKDSQSNQRPSVFEKVGIDQDLGAQIPLDARFKDDHGQDVKLNVYFGHIRSVMLEMAYYNCTMLCS